MSMDKAALTELAKALRALGDDTTLSDRERVLLWDCADALDALLEENARFEAVIRHRHRRGEYESFARFACSCGVWFADPRDRDEHVYKANEATWESLAEARAVLEQTQESEQ